MEERTFRSILQIARTIFSSAKEEQVLDLILNTAIETIPSADSGFLFLYDPLIRKLVVRSAIGFHPHAYLMTRLEPGEAISGKTFQSREPALLIGAGAVRDAMRNLSDFNRRWYLEATTGAEYPASCVSVPLVHADECLGVLTIDNFTNPAPFTLEDLQLLQMYADLAAVVIEYQKLYQRVQEQNRELSVTHEALRKEHERLQITVDFHNQISNLAAKGAGTQEILAALHANIKVPVAVFDPLLVPEGHLPKDREPLLPDEFLQHPAMQWVHRTKKWQRIDLPDSGKTIIVTPIVGADRLLGYLCAWTGQEGLVDAGKLIFEYSATVIALDWVKKEAVLESQNREKNAFLEDVLAGEMSARLQEQARFLGFDQDDYYAVLLWDTRDPTSHTLLERILDRLQIRHLSVQKSQQNIVILSLSRQLSADKRMKLFRSFLREFGRQKKAKAGIGRLLEGLSQVKRSYHDAQLSIQLSEKQGKAQRPVYFGDLGVIRFFMQHNREELEDYLNDILGPLFLYDERKNTSLLETLVAFVKFDKDLKNTTQALNIHHNTLYYRIRRIQDLLGYSFSDGDEWFNVKMACQIYLYLQDDQNRG